MAFKEGVVLGTVSLNATGTATTGIGQSSNSGTITIGNTSSGAVIINSGTAGISVGATANAHQSTFGSTNSTSSTTVQSGSGALAITSTNGTLTLTSGTGALGISTDATATTVSIANGAGVKTTTLGSTNPTSSTTVQAGSGTLNVTSTNSALTVNSGTGALSLSNDAAATTVNLATGAGAKTVTLGSTNTTSTTNLQAGSGGIVIPAFSEGALVTSSTGVVTTVTGTAGKPFVANTAGTAPSFQTLPVSGGGTGAVTLTGVLTGNGTSAVTASTITQYGTVVAGASNAVSSIAPSATSGVPYISQGAASNPTFGTAVVAGGGTGNTTFTAYSVICAGTTATGAFQNVSGVGSSGQILVSQGASALPAWTTITGGVTWSVITGDQTAVVNNGYICNKASALLLALPTTAAVGSILEVTGINTALGWKITQAAGQQIHFGASDTTSGATGYLQSSAIRDAVKLVCVVANNEWQVLSSQGNITVV